MKVHFKSIPPHGFFLYGVHDHTFRKINCVLYDLYDQVARLKQLLEAAWSEDKLTCLKIIFNMGNVRKDGGGKQDRRNFYSSLLWLWRKHPTNVLTNIHLLHQHASLKCLLNVFMYIVHLEEGEEADPSSSSYYGLAGQLAAAQKHKEVKKNIRTRNSKIARRKGRAERRAAHWAEFAASMESTVEKLRVERKREEIKAKRGKEALHEAVFLDPRVATKWCSADVAAKFATFCKKKDAEYARQQKEVKQALKQQTRAVAHKRRTDENIRRLYEAVANIFSQGIQGEYEETLKFEAALAKAAAGDESDTAKKISVGGLFAKWAPRVGGLHDKATGIARFIMQQLLPLIGLPTEAESTSTNVPRQRQLQQQRYQRDVLSRIHRAAQVPEHYVGRAEWSSVNYNRMASRCRLLWGTKVFRKHDEERYDAYLQAGAVRQLTDKGAKGAVKTGVLLPHEVTKTAGKLEDETTDQNTAAYLAKALELNLQWWGIVRACREARAEGSESSGLGYCLPMCDVSGSMSGIPMEVSVGLSILLAESMPRMSPLFGKIMTFHESPKLCSLQNVPDYDDEDEGSREAAAAAAVASGAESGGNSLDQMRQLLNRLGSIGQRAKDVLGYEWGGSTNIEAAFDLLLKLALEHQLDAAYIQRTCLVIFSDMEFDEARGVNWGGQEKNGSWDTMHEHIEKKFAAAGYPALPRIVYWNLRASMSQPIKEQDKQNVVLLAGFSAGLLRSFLKGKLEEFSPVKLLQQVLAGPLYDQLVVPEISC